MPCYVERVHFNPPLQFYTPIRAFRPRTVYKQYDNASRRQILKSFQTYRFIVWTFNIYSLNPLWRFVPLFRTEEQFFLLHKLFSVFYLRDTA